MTMTVNALQNAAQNYTSRSYQIKIRALARRMLRVTWCFFKLLHKTTVSHYLTPSRHVFQGEKTQLCATTTNDEIHTPNAYGTRRILWDDTVGDYEQTGTYRCERCERANRRLALVLVEISPVIAHRGQEMCRQRTYAGGSLH